MSVTAIPAGLALFLSVVGLYGLTAFVAVQRTHEIGVRMALGAARRDVLVLLLESLRRPFVMGVIGGSFLAVIGVIVLNRTSLTIVVSAGDPLIYAGSILLLTCTASAAALVPALRAARRQPWQVLRDL
jgi:putative ABC transport system permease protein